MAAGPPTGLPPPERARGPPNRLVPQTQVVGSYHRLRLSPRECSVPGPLEGLAQQKLSLHARGSLETPIAWTPSATPLALGLCLARPARV